MLRYALILLIALLSFGNGLVHALPLSPWYAVVWVSQDDTLHWINPQGEQISLKRPTWTSEAPTSQPWMNISPDGKTLIMVVEQANGFQGIGFYDLENGVFTQTHQASAGERFIPTQHLPSRLTSDRFAIGLTAPDAGAWRIIDFELPSGNALGQLTSNDFNTGLPTNQFYPSVISYQYDQAIKQVVVYFQMHSQAPSNNHQVFYWRPDQAQDDQVLGTRFGTSLTYNDGQLNTYPLNREFGFDILPLSGFPVNGYGAGGGSTIIEATTLQGTKTNLMDEKGAVISQIRWLKGGEWVGYHYSDQVLADHWRVVAGDGNAYPLGPNFTHLFATPDGYLAQDTENKRLRHVTTLAQEAYSSEIGTEIFSAASPFEVIYVTPPGAVFSLENLPLAPNNDLAAPSSGDCTLTPRLVVGQQGMVSFTNGTPLRLRIAPSGNIITEVKEGSVFNVLAGPVCQDGLNWWNIQVADDLSGWSAEGDADGYFMEPVGGNLPLANPTAVIVNPPLCPLSPPSQLAIGMTAKTVQTDGTLAMRVNLTDELPTHQIPVGLNVTILDGSQCRADIRMWKVETILNGQSVVGWIAEGVNGQYYLTPN